MEDRAADLEHRRQVARLLVSRCTNCFTEHRPYKEMLFVNGNVGPFCPACWKELVTHKEEIQ